MVEQIARVELEHWLHDPTWLPDAKLLAPTGPVLVLRDVEIARMANDAVTTEVQRITPSALPPGRRTYALVARDALQVQADRSGHEVAYIAFDVTFFAGVSDAHVGFSVRMALPSSTKGPILCCCGATDLFASRDGRWTLTKRRGLVCS